MTDRTPRPRRDDSAAWDDLQRAAQELSLTDFLSFKVTRLATALQRGAATDYIDRHGVSVPEWRMLCALEQFDTLSVGELIRLSGYDKALISRSLASMKNQRLVTTQPDPHHGRRLNAALTADGRALYRRILPQARARQIQLLGALSATERSVLHRALTKLQDALNRED